jgi:hypothetical protein
VIHVCCFRDLLRKLWQFFSFIQVRFRIVKRLYLASSRRISFKCGIIPSVHSASGIRDAWWNNMFAFRRFLDAAGRHCIMTFVYKIRYWHVQRWLLDFIVDSSHVEPLLKPDDDGETRPKEISFGGFWETGIWRAFHNAVITYSGNEWQAG